MSTLQLRAHPATPCPWIDAATVAVARNGIDLVTCRYELVGDLGRVRFPRAATVPVRTDGLWRHTCFELFVRMPQAAGYVEFNFSPVGHWAAYQFDGYRQGMHELPAAAPVVACAQDSGGCILTAQLRIPGIGAGLMRIAAAAVLEDQEGEISYWALHHPDGKPDFHHAAGFVVQV